MAEFISYWLRSKNSCCVCGTCVVLGQLPANKGQSRGNNEWTSGWGFHTKKVFGSDEKFAMITRKGVFPYSMLSDIEQLTKPNEIAFPCKEHFQPVEPENYAHAKKVWQAFDCISLRDYHDIYLVSDCTLLADCVQNFDVDGWQCSSLIWHGFSRVWCSGKRLV